MLPERVFYRFLLFTRIIYADLVSIAWQSTDFTTPTTTPTAASTSIQLAESSSTNTSTSTMTETPTSAPKAHSGLSAGAQAGIGVGVSIGVLSVVAIAFGIFFIRRKRRAELPQDTSFPADDDPPAELPHDGKSGRPLSELPTPAFFTPELPGSEVSQGGSNLSKSEGPTGPAELGPIL
ncbi:hypothetical protein N7470_006948 [Penicillium chermesinum]|nr:hypothetical protein N7470_006948 [Penicillium chermesinum]